MAESVSTLFPREVVSSKRRQTLGQWHCATSQKTQITIIIKTKVSNTKYCLSCVISSRVVTAGVLISP